MSPYDPELAKKPPNLQPLPPVNFLERAPSVFPDHTAVIHGPQRWSSRDFYARARRLASALKRRGLGRGDTVAVMLANTPPMLEAHYGVPMAGAVLNALNTRLDPAIVASRPTTARPTRSSPTPSSPKATSPRLRTPQANPPASTKTHPPIP